MSRRTMEPSRAAEWVAAQSSRDCVLELLQLALNDRLDAKGDHAIVKLARAVITAYPDDVTIYRLARGVITAAGAKGLL